MAVRLLTALLFIAPALSAQGASYRTENFLVQAETPELARECGEAAERVRRDVALQWLGRELPAWRDPCPIQVEVGEQLGAGGATSFMFEKRQPFGWNMQVQGSHARVLESVIPHEVAHTVFATEFGGPLPRWADEGMCTMLEADAEQIKQRKLLVRFIGAGEIFAIEQLLSMREYPQNILPLFSQGYSLARFLVGRGSKRRFVAFVKAGMQEDAWAEAARKFYGFEDLAELEHDWQAWVSTGSTDYEALVESPSAELAKNESRESDSQLASRVTDFGPVLFADVTSVRFCGPAFPVKDDDTFNELTADKNGSITIHERYIVREVPQADGAIRRSVYIYNELAGFEQLLLPRD
ncbi:MAG: hypothetical protein RIC55_13470 [Pirellulaceae bacterium]